MAFKMKGSYHYGKNPLKQEGTKEQQKGEEGPIETYAEKMKKRDWEAGSTLEEGDYATYGQQAYDKKGNKIDFEDFESTGTVKIDDKGRPYTYHGTEKIYLSSADEEGRPQSPTKQTKSGKGNIFTKKGRIQRLVNKHYETPKGTKKRQKLAKKLGKQGVFGYGDVMEHGFYHGGEHKDRGYYKDTGVKKFVPNLKSYDANLLDEITPRKKSKK
tara:strand:+ start:65 stop:706 length:642 start_codon:yes stop_codon:yes gene_type:complete